MRSAWCCAWVILAITGCSPDSFLLPDGGRALVNCETQTLSVPVTVLDRAHEPAADATVSVEYVVAQKTETLTTNSQGIAIVRNAYGTGTVRVQGSLNDLTSLKGELQFVGTECSQSVTPRALTLTLR